jgi:hypothetical protein
MSNTRLIGFDATIFNLRGLEKRVARDAAGLAMGAAGALALGEAYRNVTRSDHSLAQLRSLGHPYAKRHGSIRVHTSETHVVHSQSGSMAAALKGQVKFRAGGAGGGARPYYLLGWPDSAPRYVRWVVEGTRIMLGRDVLWASVSAPHMRVAMMRAFVTVMGKELRTQAGIRFGGT